MTKRIIEEELGDYVLSSCYDKISAKDVLLLIEEYSKMQNIDKMYFELYYEDDGYGAASGNLSLKYDREETDEEYNIRTEQDNKYLENRKKREYEEYLKLKSKFESK